MIKNLSGKYGQKFIEHAKKSATKGLKTTVEKSITKDNKSNQ